MTIRPFLQSLLACLLLSFLFHSLDQPFQSVEAFTVTRSKTPSRKIGFGGTSLTQPKQSPWSCRPLASSNNPDDNDPKPPSAQSLGFDRPSPRPLGEPQKVRVDLVDDVDSVTLTAIGFGLIALNFLALANLGDGGIGGVVATIINTLKD